MKETGLREDNERSISATSAPTFLRVCDPDETVFGTEAEGWREGGGGAKATMRLLLCCQSSPHSIRYSTGVQVCAAVCKSYFFDCRGPRTDSDDDDQMIINCRRQVGGQCPALPTISQQVQ